MTCELFGSQSFHLGEGIIDLSNIINTSVSLPIANSIHRQSAEHLLHSHVLVNKEFHYTRLSQPTTTVRYWKPSQSMMNMHHDVLGEKELRDFLMINGWGDRKAYWVSSLRDYKGPRAVSKLSRFIALCKSIEMYIEEDGKESIRLLNI